MDQPIPPMIRANDYVEVNTDDMNIVIKGLVNTEHFDSSKIAIGQMILTNEKTFLQSESTEMEIVYFQWQLKQQKRKMEESSELRIT